MQHLILVDGKWYFADETGDLRGPYYSPQAASIMCSAYAFYLEYGIESSEIFHKEFVEKYLTRPQTA